MKSSESSIVLTKIVVWFKSHYQAASERPGSVKSSMKFIYFLMMVFIFSVLCLRKKKSFPLMHLSRALRIRIWQPEDILLNLFFLIHPPRFLRMNDNSFFLIWNVWKLSCVCLCVFFFSVRVTMMILWCACNENYVCVRGAPVCLNLCVNAFVRIGR